MNKDITNTQGNTDSLKSIFTQSLAAGIAGLILAFFLLCVISLFLYINPLNYETVAIVSMSAKYFCAIVVAFIACARRRNKGYLRGLSGVLIFMLLGGLLFSLFSPNGFDGSVFLYDLLICSVLGILTGAVAVNFNTKKKRRK